MQIRNLSAVNWQQLQTVTDKLSATENRLLVESRCLLSVVVGDATHSESLVLHYS